MPTQTEHYKLNQWEAGDNFLRTDFNEDNAKIDAAIKAAAESKPYVIGTYTGTNSAATKRVVELGFQPSAVIIAYPSDSSGEYGTTITKDQPLTYSGSVMAQVTETGFEVALVSTGGSTAKPYTNLGGPYIYIAFR